MKRLVFLGIVKVAEAMVAVIRRGKRPWVVVGSVLGAVLGSSLGILLIWWVIPGIALGGFVGATAFAALFPGPIEIPTPPSVNGRPFAPGALLAAWASEWNGVKRILVLMERSIYVAWDNDAPWEHVRTQLTAGLDPMLPNGDLIPLEALERIQFPDNFDVIAFDICFSRGADSLSRMVVLSSPYERDRFLDMLGNQLGGTFARAQVPDAFFESTGFSLGVLIVFAALAGGAMFMSDYWIAHPPPNPVGKKERDPLVASLMYLGPLGVLMVSTVPILPAAAWFVFRIVRRTTTTVLTPQNRAAPNTSTASTVASQSG